MADMHRNQLIPSPLPAQTVDGASRGSSDGIIFPSLSRTNATYTSDPIYNANARGLRLFVDATVVGAGPGTLIVSIEQKDPISGNWVADDNSTSATWNAIQTRTLTLYPGLLTAAGSATTNTIGNIAVGVQFRVKVIVGVNAVTFSVAGEFLL